MCRKCFLITQTKPLFYIYLPEPGFKHQTGTTATSVWTWYISFVLLANSLFCSVSYMLKSSTSKPAPPLGFTESYSESGLHLFRFALKVLFLPAVSCMEWNKPTVHQLRTRLAAFSSWRATYINYQEPNLEQKQSETLMILLDINLKCGVCFAIIHLFLCDSNNKRD